MALRPSLIFPRMLRSVADLGEFLRDLIASYDKGRASVTIAAGAEGTNTRRITVQVVNRRGENASGAWTFVLTIGTANTGAPAGTQTFTHVTGSVLSALIANQSYIVTTGTTGAYVFDLNVSGAETRYVSVAIDGEVVTSAGILWAA